MAELSESGAYTQRKMVRALKAAQEAWQEADMPTIFVREPGDTGKIAIAIVATKLFDQIT